VKMWINISHLFIVNICIRICWNKGCFKKSSFKF